MIFEFVGANAEKDFQDKADAGRRESSGLRGEVNTLAATLSSLREELKNNEKKEQKKSLELLKTISLLNDDKDDLQKLLNASNLSVTNSNQKSFMELNLIKKKMDEREIELNKEKKIKEEMNRKVLENFQAKHLAEIENEKSIQNSLISSAESKEKQILVIIVILILLFYLLF